MSFLQVSMLLVSYSFCNSALIFNCLAAFKCPFWDKFNIFMWAEVKPVALQPVFRVALESVCPTTTVFVEVMKNLNQTQGYVCVHVTISVKMTNWIYLCLCLCADSGHLWPLREVNAGKRGAAEGCIGVPGHRKASHQPLRPVAVTWKNSAILGPCQGSNY